ncbi:hypothetical protein [Nocardia salmonicida]|uniref:hypothetical protein n=1 Tax=Nocardia salmonicida TaxID=53431 RepID=UPI00379A701B
MARRMENGSETTVGAIGDLPVVELADSPLTADRVEGLSSAARHRIAAFVHTTLAELDELPEPLVPPIEVTSRSADRER